MRNRLAVVLRGGSCKRAFVYKMKMVWLGCGCRKGGVDTGEQPGVKWE